MTQKTRIRVLSDLHNEFRPIVLEQIDADVTVLGGDIDIGDKGVRWAASAFAGQPVIYVAGNHEYYGRAIPKLTEQLARVAADSHVMFLECTAVTIGSIRILGCTLWSDFQITGNRMVAMAASADAMTDFRRIRVSPSFRKLRPSDVASWHVRSVNWLRAQFQEGDSRRTVVVTHHAPSARSLSPASRADPIAAAYASALDELIAESGVALWVHGHTHCCVDYRIGVTRVVSNPRGYPDDPVDGFDPNLVVVVDC
ncbi:MAG: metallophosphoesterase [Bacteroidales bacterium]